LNQTELRIKLKDYQKLGKKNQLIKSPMQGTKGTTSKLSCNNQNRNYFFSPLIMK